MDELLRRMESALADIGEAERIAYAGGMRTTPVGVNLIKSHTKLLTAVNALKAQRSRRAA